MFSFIVGVVVGFVVGWRYGDQVVEKIKSYIGS